MTALRERYDVSFLEFVQITFSGDLGVNTVKVLGCHPAYIPMVHQIPI
jgi:hypothetical protein